MAIIALLPYCLAESFPWTLPAPGIIIRTELRSLLSGFKNLNDLNCVLDLKTWLNASELDILVITTVVLRLCQWCLGAFGPF